MVAVMAHLSASALAQTGQAACERLRSLQIGSSRVLTAKYIAAGDFQASGSQISEVTPLSSKPQKTAM
jgi:hypothetical protein